MEAKRKLLHHGAFVEVGDGEAGNGGMWTESTTEFMIPEHCRDPFPRILSCLAGGRRRNPNFKP